MRDDATALIGYQTSNLGRDISDLLDRFIQIPKQIAHIDGN